MEAALNEDNCARVEEAANGARSRRVWESPDYCVTKVVLEEGDLNNPLPRFGAACAVSAEEVSCSGAVDLTRLKSDSAVSKHLSKKGQNEDDDGLWVVGMGDTEVDRTLERCLQTMRVGERSECSIRAKIDADKNCVQGLSSADGWVHVECELRLDRCINADPIYKWYAETKLDKAKEANADAVALFKAKRRLDAFVKFRLTLTLLTFVLEAEVGTEKEEKEKLVAEAEDLRMTCLSNLAACHFQWGNYAFVIDLASKVLARQADNVKLLYRRGVAHLERSEFAEAKTDLVEAHRLDPTNKAINEKMGQLRLRERKHLEQISAGMKKIFG